MSTNPYLTMLRHKPKKIAAKAFLSFCLTYMHILCIYIYIQKLFEHQRVFEKLSYQEKDRGKWSKVLVCDMMMSSEESGEEGPARSSIVVKSLPWMSTRVNNFMVTR